VIRDLDEEHPIRVLFDKTFKETDGTYGDKQIAGLQAVQAQIKDNIGY
jgi:hypothetical protein